MFSKVEAGKTTSFLDQTKAAREERAQGKHQDHAATKIQALIRGYITRRKIHRDIRSATDKLLCIPEDADTEYKPVLQPALTIFKGVAKLLFISKEDEDKQRFEYLCKYILNGMNNDNIKLQYVSLALNKTHVLVWIQQLKDLLWQCCNYFKCLKPESPRDLRMISTLLHMLILFTSTAKWRLLQGKSGEALKPGMNQLCNNVMGNLNARGLYPALQALLMRGLARSKPCFKQTTLSAVTTIALRPLIAAGFSDNLLTLFLLHFMSVPAIVYHLNFSSQETVAMLIHHRVFRRSLDLLCNEQSTKIVFNVLEGNYALCLLANLIQLGFIEMEGLVDNTDNFMRVVQRLLDCCNKYVQSKKSNLTHWHPVLGWFAQSADHSLHEAMSHVVKQLQLLWSLKMLRILYEPLVTHTELQVAAQAQRVTKPSTSKNILKKAMEKASDKHGPRVKVRTDGPMMSSTCLACRMFLTGVNTLSQLRLDLLGGLCCGELLLPRLWHLITDLGPQCGLKSFTDLLVMSPSDTSHPLFALLQLACDTAVHIITIIDDVELYEQGKPFSKDNLVAISYFLNHFLFRITWNGLIDVKTAGTNPVFQSCHSLLMLLYERDCRRAFAPQDHWLIKDIKASTFITELERGRKAPQFLRNLMPHIIPHKERVILFRRQIVNEKEVQGLTESACMSPQSTLITVHRQRIIEDGYRQLALLPPNALKGLIRVKFVNEQGLDEAGIDQDGVFKEFLEETIKRVFDPSLNLFKVTSEQKLYPSPTSYIQENHLALFEFVGRMLGKAVYEGIVVEVPFAMFFLTQMLGHSHSSTYSSIDELPSLDPELYKNLTYVKHYEGDIADLDLTFSTDEDNLGKLVTYELIPGGRAINVTNDNKINYVHLMAHFKMRTQVRDQTAAFVRGFKSMVSWDWLQMFSGPELQKLISGDSADLDLQDLRRNTQYHGGFHNNHRVVNWLWNILENDFTPAERGQFLKFVTSCSKAPLLGFTHLEPPFSIRCVEVSEDQDTGDTVGSVLKGFFHLGRRETVGRLPTSSTCFNLLKLPNYNRKSTLREKLRYAICSNTGFELS